MVAGLIDKAADDQGIEEQLVRRDAGAVNVIVRARSNLLFCGKHGRYLRGIPSILSHTGGRRKYRRKGADPSRPCSVLFRERQRGGTSAREMGEGGDGFRETPKGCQHRRNGQKAGGEREEEDREVPFAKRYPPFARSESRPLFLISQRILTTLLFAAIPENPAGRGHPEPGKKGEKGYEDH